MIVNAGERGATRRLVAPASILTTTILLARVGTLAPGEERVFRWINEWPDAWRRPIIVVMQGGNGLMALAVPAALASTGRGRGHRVSVGLSAFVGWQLAKVVKHFVRRGRPGDLLDDVHLRDGNPDGHGLVSGHSTVAFAVAAAVAPVLSTSGRRAGFTWAAAVAVARVYVGAHLPLDVVGGAALGSMLGQLGALGATSIRRRAGK